MSARVPNETMLQRNIQETIKQAQCALRFMLLGLAHCPLGPSEDVLPEDNEKEPNYQWLQAAPSEDQAYPSRESYANNT